MAERPPPGYARRDKPLPHSFQFKTDINLAAGGTKENNFAETFLRTSKITNDPKTIEVHRRNTSFAKDLGALICFDSMVRLMTVNTTVSLNTLAIDTDKFHAMKFYYQNIHGSYEDSWTPKDTLTTQTIAQILGIVKDATNEDCIPNTSQNKMVQNKDHPLSTVTASEAFGDYDYLTDAKHEGLLGFDIQEYFDMLQYGTNGGFLKTIAGSIHSFILTPDHPVKKIFQTKFVPRNVQFGVPFLYFGRRWHVPKPPEDHSINSEAQTVTTGSHATINTICRLNEWNPDFDQARM